MKTHQLQSLTRLSTEQIHLLLSDSNSQSHLLDHVKNAISLDRVRMIHWIRLHQTAKATFQLMTDLKANELRQYLKSKLWIHDSTLRPVETSAFEVLNENKSAIRGKGYQRQYEDQTLLFIGKRLASYHDHFIFSLDKSYFEQLNQSQQVMLYHRLLNAMQLARYMLTFEHVFTVPIYEVTGPEQLKAVYGLTDTNVEYLKMIASGAQSKEIAQHLNKSPRSVEDACSTLAEKLQCMNKHELVYVARVLVSYIQ